MPTTAARRWTWPLALRWWREQEYAGPTELIVVWSGPEAPPLLGRDVQVIRQEGLLGAKYNAGVRRAHGELVAIWEDDDWHGPRRLEAQVEALVETRAQLCGASRMLFWDMQLGAMHLLQMPERALAHGAFCGWRRVWEQFPYPEHIGPGFDSEWQRWAIPNSRVVDLECHGWYLAVRHGENDWRTTGYRSPPWTPDGRHAGAVMGGEPYEAYRRAWAARQPTAT